MKESGTYAAVSQILPELRQAARDGALHVWGVTDPDNITIPIDDLDTDRTFEPIEAIHWRTYRVYPHWLLFERKDVHTLEKRGAVRAEFVRRTQNLTITG